MKFIIPFYFAKIIKPQLTRNELNLSFNVLLSLPKQKLASYATIFTWREDTHGFLFGKRNPQGYFQQTSVVKSAKPIYCKALTMTPNRCIYRQARKYVQMHTAHIYFFEHRSCKRVRH